MTNPAAIERFSNRVDNYQRYRPGYPTSVYTHLKKETGIDTLSKIVDLGYGTGLLSRLFLEQGHLLWGVEPNLEMRVAGEAILKDQRAFTSLDGKAENIPLGNEFADLLVAGQAFHWFDPLLARKEALRVLKSSGFAALIWNDWNPDLSPLLYEYDALLNKFGSDYASVSRKHAKVSKNIEIFYGSSGFQIEEFPHNQIFNFEAFKGRLLSSSYVPLENSDHFKEMIARLEKIFTKYEVKGKIVFDYRSRVYLGQPQ